MEGLSGVSSIWFHAIRFSPLSYLNEATVKLQHRISPWNILYSITVMERTRQLMPNQWLKTEWFHDYFLSMQYMQYEWCMKFFHCHIRWLHILLPKLLTVITTFKLRKDKNGALSISDSSFFLFFFRKFEVIPWRRQCCWKRWHMWYHPRPTIPTAWTQTGAAYRDTSRISLSCRSSSQNQSSTAAEDFSANPPKNCGLKPAVWPKRFLSEIISHTCQVTSNEPRHEDIYTPDI